MKSESLRKKQDCESGCEGAAVSLYLQSICADDECCCYLFWVSRGEVIKSVVPQFPGRHYSYPPHPHYPGPSHHLIDTLVGGRAHLGHTLTSSGETIN